MLPLTLGTEILPGFLTLMSIGWFWFATGKNRILKYLGPDRGATMTTLMQAEAGTCYESPLNRRVGDAKRLTNKQTNMYISNPGTSNVQVQVHVFS